VPAVAGSGRAALLPRPAPFRRAEVAAAYRECVRVARAHDENLTVGSFLLPRALRRHVAAIYAFARAADDMADEGDLARAERLARLDAWQWALEEAYRGRPTAPVFVALADTAARFSIPITPFRRLLRAFRSDVDFRPFATFAELRGYCRDSTDPVGHLILYLVGHGDEQRQALSDRVCTGLQLANFWQDVSVDARKGSVYVPQEDLARFGVSEEDLLRGRDGEQVRALVAFEVERARAHLVEGLALADTVAPRLAREVRMFAGGGLAILDRIEADGFATASRRPTLSRADKAAVLLRGLVGRASSAAHAAGERARRAHAARAQRPASALHHRDGGRRARCTIVMAGADQGRHRRRPVRSRGHACSRRTTSAAT